MANIFTRLFGDLVGRSGASSYARQQALLGDAGHIHKVVIAEAGDDADPDDIARVCHAIEVARGFREPTGDRYEGVARWLASLPSDMLDEIDALDDADLADLLRDPEVAELIERMTDGIE